MLKVFIVRIWDSTRYHEVGVFSSAQLADCGVASWLETHSRFAGARVWISERVLDVVNGAHREYLNTEQSESGLC